MKVGINVAILWSPLSGIGQYTLALIRALIRVDGDTEWVLFGVPMALEGLPRGEHVEKVETSPLVGWRRIVWEQLELPRLAARKGVQVLHCPDFSRPLRCKIPVINTIHDLSYYEPEPFYSPAKRVYKRAMTRNSVTRSAAIIAISQFTRSSILQRFPLPGGRIFVIHHGTEEVVSTPRLLRPNPPFLLFVGTLESRKNVVTLVQAYGQLKKEGRIPHRLVLAGQPGCGWQDIQQAIQHSGVSGDIDLPGYVSREELLRLYRSADLFICPSFYEGFGLPVLEAMVCGTPVVCSRATSLPEIAGDAAEFFDAYSAEDLAGAMERVLQSPDLQARLRQKGLDRAQLFSWEECARKHCEVYRRVLRS